MGGRQAVRAYKKPDPRFRTSSLRQETVVPTLKQQPQVDKVTYNVHALLTDLKCCRDIRWGRRLHVKAMESWHESNMHVLTALIRMYGKCGSMVDARRMFDSIQSPDVVCWTALLLGYADNGDGLSALELFSKMKSRGCAPNSVTYVAAVKACTSLAEQDGDGQGEWLKRGRDIHSEIGCDLDMFVQSALINMYARCGSMVDARCVFESIQNPNVVCWNALLLGYTENGDGLSTMELFSRMKACGCAPDSVTYIAALKACTYLAGGGQSEWFKRGREIHFEIGCHLCIFVQNTLMDMYAKCGSIGDAHHIFDSIKKPGVVSWNVLLLGYAENGKGLVSLDLFSKMKACGCAPDSVTYLATLKACVSLVGKGDQGEWLKRGRKIHSEIRCGLSTSVQNTLIDMYGKCGCMVDARSVFDSIQKPNVVSWTAILMGYVENGDQLAALELFAKMKSSGCLPNSETYVAALKACTYSAGKRDASDQCECLQRGREIHSEIGCDLNIFSQSTLINMYGKCCSMIEARSVFESIRNPNVICWNALLQGYTENGDGLATMELFSRMKASGCAPDSVTCIAALKACALLAVKRDCGGQAKWLKCGKEIHSEIVCDLNILLQTSLVGMYASCGSMTDAREVFDSIEKPDVVSWTTLLLGYADNGDGLTTLDMFSKMKACGCAPDSVAYIAVLKACGLIGALVLGRKFHSEITDFTTHVVTCLVDFYAKCGSIVEACKVFYLHSTARVVPTWNALLAGYSTFGDTESMFSLFEAMQDQGFQPDTVTFVCMLSCCSHAGLVGKAKEYFQAMPTQYGVTPTLIHYTCMVDVLGRANRLHEAIVVLRKMPCSPAAVAWMTLLGACHKWKNVEIGRYAFQHVVEMDKANASAYVLMAQIYGSKGMSEEVLEMKAKLGSWKLQGQSYVVDEMGNMINFSVREEDPPEIKDKLEELIGGMGYVHTASAI